MTTLVLFFDTIVIKQKIDGTRLVISKIVLNAFSENPINGLGYGQFHTHFYQYVDQDIIDMQNYEFQDAIQSFDESVSDEELLFEGITNRALEKMTHNDFYTVIAELGLVGLAFLIFLFYKLYAELKKLLLYSRNNFFLSIGLIVGSLIFSMLHNNLTSFVFWFVLFVPFIMNRNYERTT